MLGNESRVSEMFQKQNQVTAEVKEFHAKMKASVDEMSKSLGFLPSI